MNTVEDDGIIWRIVEEYPNYQVSNNGLVLSTRSGRVLRPGVSKRGYHFVGLTKSGFKAKSVLVHRVVGIAFVNNPNPEVYDCINHANGIKTDNRAENLEWCDRKYNLRHAIETGLRDSGKMAIIKLINGAIVGNYESVTAAAKENEVSKSEVSRCARGIVLAVRGAEYRFT